MRRCEVNVLVRSVYETWEKKKLNELIAKVFNRLKNVLVLIVDGKGGNKFVESKRGKRFRNLDLSVDQLNSINDDSYDNEDDVDDSIDQYLDQNDDQDNDNNNEPINGRRIPINEEVYDEIGMGGY